MRISFQSRSNKTLSKIDIADKNERFNTVFHACVHMYIGVYTNVHTHSLDSCITGVCICNYIVQCT